jgi:hypothetical protein
MQSKSKTLFVLASKIKMAAATETFIESIASE